MSVIAHRGVHVPACPSLTDHIDAAVRETAGSQFTLDDFVAALRADWQEEQQIADAGDLAVIAYWQRQQAEWMRLQGISQ